MATDFIMPRLADTKPSHFFQRQPPLHTQALAPAPAQAQPNAHVQSPDYALQQGYQSRQVSPLSTSNNGSPTSPKPYHRQRLRPMYMPAVLRPNSFYNKANGNKHDGVGQGQDDGSLSSSPTSFINLPGLGALSRLSRRDTGDSGKCMEGDWDMDMFPKPTATPTREHWKPDPEATICDEPSCLRHFSYWTRKHHCRRCGNIFCDQHSAFAIPLDQDANYNPRGTISRACSHCYSEFQAWRSRTNSQVSSDESTGGQDSETAPSSPTVTSPTVATPTGTKPHPSHPAEVAMSVPRDWHWSTF